MRTADPDATRHGKHGIDTGDELKRAVPRSYDGYYTRGKQKSRDGLQLT